MQESFAKLPWALGRLAKSGLRAYGQCFLTPNELRARGTEPPAASDDDETSEY